MVNGTLSASALFAARTELLGDGWFQWVDFSSNYIKRRGIMDVYDSIFDQLNRTASMFDFGSSR